MNKGFDFGSHKGFVRNMFLVVRQCGIISLDGRNKEGRRPVSRWIQEYDSTWDSEMIYIVAAAMRYAFGSLGQACRRETEQWHTNTPMVQMGLDVCRIYEKDTYFFTYPYFMHSETTSQRRLSLSRPAACSHLDHRFKISARLCDLADQLSLRLQLGRGFLTNAFLLQLSEVCLDFNQLVAQLLSDRGLQLWQCRGSRALQLSDCLNLSRVVQSKSLEA